MFEGNLKIYNRLILLLWMLMQYAFDADTSLFGDGGLGQHDLDRPMFAAWTEEWLDETVEGHSQRNYGVAVCDVDFDGTPEFFVAGFSGPNIVLKFNREIQAFENLALPGSPYEALMDPDGEAIGVCACDIDGDGTEEIYVLNTNGAYAGISAYPDKLFKWRNGKYIDLYNDSVNKNITGKNYAGRSVVCLDRYGRGKYGFMISTYSHQGTGQFALIEMKDYDHNNDINTGHIVLHNVAHDAGLDKVTGGRAAVVGPILNNKGKLDIFFNNEGNNFLGNSGKNFLFMNLGNGTFIDVAMQYGLADEEEAGRGTLLCDVNGDGHLDIAYGNYEGPHRLYLQNIIEGKRSFENAATPEFYKKSSIRSMVGGDFDNDGDIEIYFNNIVDYNKPQPNKLIRITSYGQGKIPGISTLNPGDAEESDGYGTGCAYADINGDGLLELLVSHGEDVAQPLEIYQVQQYDDVLTNNWIRIDIRTKYGAPARGATGTLRLKNGFPQHQVVDSGSGYLCQMDPVLHFGLGGDMAVEVYVQWPDGQHSTWILAEKDQRKVIIIPHPHFEAYEKANKASNITIGLDNSKIYNHTEL